MTMIVAGCGAALGWAALALQLVLTLTTIGGSALHGLWRYIGYFTIIANLFASITLTLAVLGVRRPRLEFAAATAMILVGVVYSLLLRETWDPRGGQKLADVALHDAMPVVVALFWLLRPHGGLRWKDVWLCVILPLGYFVYALVRGAFDGWYPYAFMDVGQFGAAVVAVNCVVMGAAFLAMAALLKILDARLP
jgi:ABC-type Fe3+-siderophore transport system permease subunit